MFCYFCITSISNKDEVSKFSQKLCDYIWSYSIPAILFYMRVSYLLFLKFGRRATNAQIDVILLILFNFFCLYVALPLLSNSDMAPTYILAPLLLVVLNLISMILLGALTLM